MMLRILFDNRPDGRRFYNLSRKHTLFKKYYSNWDKRVITFAFDNEEQKEVISNIIFGVLSEINVKYKVIE